MTISQPPSEAIKRLIQCPSPQGLLELMASDPALRDRERIAEMRVYAGSVEKSNQPLAEQIDVVASEMERVFECIDAAPGEGTFGAINNWLESYGYGWVTATKRLLLAASAEARKAGDQASRRRLVGALLLMRRIERLHEWVAQNVKSSDLLEQLEARQDVPLADYIEWLRLRGQLEDQYAPQFLWLREFITTLKRVSSPTFTASPTPGFVRFSIPVTDGVAHAWFASDPAFLETCEHRVATATVEEWPSVLDDLIRCFFDESDWELYAKLIEERGGAGEPGVRIYAGTVICEVALMHGPPALTEAALETYRNTVTSGECHALPRPIRETHVYHYVYALVRMWARTRDPKPIIEAAIKLGEDAIAGAESTRPRLIRDMHFACARLYERLGEWDRANFDRAALHYRAGLGIEALKTERDPRARALADLANTLHRSGAGTRDEIEALFKEALLLRPIEESSLSAASGRLNYGIFLFEQVGTTVAKARAIELLEQAEAAFPGMDAEVKETPWGKELLASIWMTRGNLLREEGSQSTIEESLQLYDKATRLVGDDPWSRPMRTLLGLNRCFGHLDLYELTEKESELVAADLAADEAATHAMETAAVAEARLCKALVGLRAGDPPASLLQTIEECSRTVRSAGGVVRSLSALAWRARVGVTSGDPAQLTEGRNLFREGMETALSAGLYFEYLQHARGFADASAIAWRLSNDPKLLKEALDALEQARTAIEAQLAVDVLIVDTDNAHAHLAAVAAELTWLRAALGDPVETVLLEATVAKGPDAKAELVLKALASNLSDKEAGELNRLRRGDWGIRRDVVNRARVDAKVTADVIALKTSERERAMFVGKSRRDLIRHPVRINEVSPEEGLVLDITVCRWGSVIVAISNSGASAIVAPFSLSKLSELQQSWFDEYDDSGEPPHHETDDVVEALEHLLLAHVADLIASASRIVFVPHVLAGIPLHAARVGGGARTLEQVTSVAYATNVLAVTKKPHVTDWRRKRVLCMALDPGGADELVNACGEVADAAKALLDGGAEVTVVAESGGRQGLAAFALRGVVLDPRATCETPSALSSWISDNLRLFDHVLVASHGAYGASGGVIVVPGGNISVLDLLASSELKPGSTVHLSACETAMRLGRVYSLAGGLFHMGAASVVGTCWRVRDRDALCFSDAFYSELTMGTRSFEQAATVASLQVRSQVGDAAIERWSPFLALLG